MEDGEDLAITGESVQWGVDTRGIMDELIHAGHARGGGIWGSEHE